MAGGDLKLIFALAAIYEQQEVAICIGGHFTEP
jgi:hypothetical protein